MKRSINQNSECKLKFSHVTERQFFCLSPSATGSLTIQKQLDLF